MTPDTTTVETDDGIVRWTNEDFSISVDEAEAVADEVRRGMDRPGVSGVLVDNRAAENTWPSDVNDVWSALMADIYAADLPCATVSPSVTNAMQINRLASEQGTDDLIQAFDAAEYEEALAFLDAA